MPSLGINCLKYDEDGGQANVDAGSSLGMAFPIWKKSWSRISSKFGLFEGSKFNIDVMRDLA